MKALGAKLAAALGLLAVLSSPTAQAALPGQGFLPDNRAWEMVSPAAKNGGEIAANSQRTRAAADGSAIGFISLAAFGDAIGSGVATDYASVRSTDPDPGTSGWSTHAITPKQDPNQLLWLLSQLEPLYVHEYTPDLQRGIFIARSPLTNDPSVKDVVNLYLRTDLRTPGSGGYELITACPRCIATKTALPPLPGNTLALEFRPIVVGVSPDLDRILFESRHRLSIDTPAPADPEEPPPRLFEWEGGAVHLAGRVPAAGAIACDDAATPACVAAAISVGGPGAREGQAPTPHTVSDGSDGHSHVFFLVPTDEAGTELRESSSEGNLYVRTDGTATAKLNASEREAADAATPARYFDAAADGSRAFFTSKQALTDDAPANGVVKLYSYDTTKPPQAPDNLTFLSPDESPADDSDVRGVIGASEDGSRVYFIAQGQLVSGEPLPPSGGIYLWHAGEVSYVAQGPTGQAVPPFGGSTEELLSSSDSGLLSPRQARVTPDGVHLLFSAIKGEGLLSHYGGADSDHGSCISPLGIGCRELYLYDAEADTLQCASCKPGGGAASILAENDMAGTFVRRITGGTLDSVHQTKALSDDGRFAFFSSAEKLVAEDTNGTVDAYVFDSSAAEPHLLSSGEDSSPSWFLDASADGSDAFFVTREQLSGWDVAQDYDLYDARVGGGFPEPPPPPPRCIGDACQPAPPSLNDPTPGTAVVSGPGNRTQGGPIRCRKGERKVKRRGKPRCVKRRRARR